jgi:ubiquinone/menaquinone biosynthesis C-methylase UbiE
MLAATATATTTTDTTKAPDLEAIKQKQQKAWASGDYGAVAARIPIISERLVDLADVRAGWRVLDVAGGTGNTALAAARSGSHVTSLDYVPELLARAEERARAEGLPLELVEGDAESLPFPDASFDAVVSALGVMFAPDQERAAAELVRVTRPGGTIALASWTPDGFIGEMFRTVARYVPAPARIDSPMRWGTKHGIGALLGDAVSSIGARHRTYTFRFPSAEAFVEFFRTNYGPTLKAFEALNEAGRSLLADDLTELVERHDRQRNEAAVAVAADYLEIVAVRASSLSHAA